jgi:hypothetical protein
MTTATAEDRLAPLGTNRFQRTILFGLNRMGKHIYAGTVPASTIAKRRAANKVARASRRTNRSSK